MKKGQISLFVIMGFILIIIFGTFFIFRSISSSSETENIAASSQDFENGVNSINAYVQACVDRSSEVSLKLFGAAGSTFTSEAGYFDSDPNFVKVAYLRDGSENFLPTLNEWEGTLGILSSLYLELCNLSVFEEQGYNIQKDTAIVKAYINRNSVDFNVNMPITVKKGEFQKELNSFNTKYDVRLPLIHDTINDIINKNIENPGFFLASDLLEYEPSVDILVYNNGVDFIYLIQDNGYVFTYADKDETMVSTENIIENSELVGDEFVFE